jgi:hypothetical protein
MLPINHIASHLVFVATSLWQATRQLPQFRAAFAPGSRLFVALPAKISGWHSTAGQMYLWWLTTVNALHEMQQTANGQLFKQRCIMQALVLCMASICDK